MKKGALSAAMLLLELVLVLQGVSAGTTVDHRGNFIRTLLPMSAGTFTAPNREMLYFNATAVHDNEDVTRARLYLHRRKLIKSPRRSDDGEFLPKPARVVLYQIQTPASQPKRVVSLPINPTTLGGWIHVDLTSEFNEIHGISQFFSVQFIGPKGSKIPLNNFLKRIKPKNKRPSSAYLVVVSRRETQEHPKERHFKHKEWKSDSNELPNEIYPHSALPEVRHSSSRNTHRANRPKQSDDDLKHKRELRIMPFLHLNEMSDIQRRLRTKRFIVESVKFAPRNADMEGRTRLQLQTNSNSIINGQHLCRPRHVLPETQEELSIVMRGDTDEMTMLRRCNCHPC